MFSGIKGPVPREALESCLLSIPRGRFGMEDIQSRTRNRYLGWDFLLLLFI